MDRAPEPKTVQFRVAPGVRLAADAWGETHRPPVVLLHGGGQTRHSWHDTGAALARRGWYVLAVDQRGHGDSDWVHDGDYRIEHYVQDLCVIAGTLSAPPVLVGASLGGMVGLLAAGEPGNLRLRALVLVDIVPRIETRGEGRVRAFMAGKEGGFESVEDAADAVARYLPHRERPANSSGLEKNLRYRRGRYYWHWDARMMQSFARGGLLRKRLEHAARGLTLPTLLVRGELSDVVSRAGAREFLEAVPHAAYVEVAGAGHMVAGDSNARFTDTVVDFLAKL